MNDPVNLSQGPQGELRLLVNLATFWRVGLEGIRFLWTLFVSWRESSPLLSLFWDHCCPGVHVRVILVTLAAVSDSPCPSLFLLIHLRLALFSFFCLCLFLLSA